VFWLKASNRPFTVLINKAVQYAAIGGLMLTPNSASGLGAAPALTCLSK